MQRQAWVYFGLSVVLCILLTFSCIITGGQHEDEDEYEQDENEEELGQH